MAHARPYILGRGEAPLPFHSRPWRTGHGSVFGRASTGESVLRPLAPSSAGVLPADLLAFEFLFCLKTERRSVLIRPALVSARGGVRCGGGGGDGDEMMSVVVGFVFGLGCVDCGWIWVVVGWGRVWVG